ncbi:hypothetical protein GQ457_07G041520 [Hibiscus cannabinus]
MGIERDGMGVREAFDDDVEEEEIGVWDGEEEVTCVGGGLEVEEPVGEFSNGGEVILEAVEDDLGEMRNSGGFPEEEEEKVSTFLLESTCLLLRTSLTSGFLCNTSCKMAGNTLTGQFPTTLPIKLVDSTCLIVL